MAELTATARAGLHRYTFKRPGAGHLLVDLAHGYQDKPDVPCKVTDATLRDDPVINVPEAVKRTLRAKPVLGKDVQRELTQALNRFKAAR